MSRCCDSALNTAFSWSLTSSASACSASAEAPSSRALLHPPSRSHVEKLPVKQNCKQTHGNSLQTDCRRACEAPETTMLKEHVHE